MNCPYCHEPDMKKCVRLIYRHTNFGLLYRWMMVMIDRHDTTNTEVWFYPSWQHGMNERTVKLNAEYLLVMKTA